MNRKRLALWAAMVGVSASALAGWQYTAVTRSEGQGRQSAADSKVKALVDGDRTRVEFLESGNPMMKGGCMLVTKDGGKNTYLVDPEKKTYSKWDMPAMMNMASSTMKMMGMKVSDLKTEKLLEEDGGKVAGFPTKHYRFRTTYQMEMNYMGMRNATSFSREQDVWASTEVPGTAFGFWLKKDEFKTGDEQMDSMIQAGLDQVKGVMLKQVSTQSSKNAQGQTQVTTVTMEVSDVKEASPAASVFELPDGYRETSLFEPRAGAKGSGPGMGMPPFMNKNFKPRPAPAPESPVMPK